MSSYKYRSKKRKRALQEVENLVENSSNLLIIHYSCESFYNIKDGRTPRITSIAIKYFNTGQTETFSIHKVAEKKGLLGDIKDHYNELERDMLDHFYKFVEAHQKYNWIHWNMRDINYGFPAIDHRYSVLGGTPKIIPDANKFDLARKLVDIYGDCYADHPRLEKLIELNEITKKEFLNGADEAHAFENKEYVKLHQSTLRKVHIFHSVVEKVIDKSLKTKSSWWKIHGLTPQGIFEAFRENFIFNLILFVLGAILSAIIGIVVTNIF